MAKIFNNNNCEFIHKDQEVHEFSWSSASAIDELVNSKNLKFNIRILDPGKYSYPYHSHRNAEEMFIILEEGC